MSVPRLRPLILSFYLTALLTSGVAYADCASPAGVEGTLDYDNVNHILRYCNGTSWVMPGDLADGDKGDITVSSSGAAWGIDAGAVTNAMLAGSIAASKLVGTDISTVGSITSGTWSGTAI